MRVLIFAAIVAATAASVIHMDKMDSITIGKDTLVNVDVKVREMCIMKLLRHILQPTMYEDIRTVAREWSIEDNMDKYLKTEVVKKFIDTFKMGMLPRGEVFVHTNEKHMKQAVRVFRMMYFAKDFDVFMRTCCWLRERINGGMFTYALTAAVFHRVDCRGIVLPAPYEIYPYFFVDADVMQKASLLKMSKMNIDNVLMNYWGVKIVKDKHICLIDARKGLRTVMSEDDKMNYFTEDCDLNTYFYYLHMNYPYWMDNEVYGLQKERRGEVMMYAGQQLMARYRLERLSHGMCDIKMIKWDETIKGGYWPKIRMHNGYEMPARVGNMKVLNEDNLRLKLVCDDVEKIIRQAILTGKMERRDGTVITLKKAEDYEYLARMLCGGMGMLHDDAKVIHVTNLLKKMLSYSLYNVDKETYIPTAIDMYTTCLRDPLYWRLMKRVQEMAVLFKTLLPKYTREELSFPGVKVESISTDKLVTFMDEYDMDISNGMYLDESEMKKKNMDMIMIARQRRLNNHPFKVTVDVASDKATDCIVRIFIGPKYDCMGRLLDVNKKRLDMVEIDSFLYKLDTGKNTIVRKSIEMHGVIEDRPMTRMMMDKDLGLDTNVGVDVRDRVMVDSWWHKTRRGFPSRLLLPLGHKGGMEMQMFVIVSPVRTGLTLPTVDMTIMKDRRTCFWTTCVDTMPLGFPFDREIDYTCFFMPNMLFTDIMVFRKDMDLANMNKDVDMSNMVMRRDDLTIFDKDMLMHMSYKDVMLMSVDKMMRM
ncbi:basic juvenile hormone-suppressible protein 1-like [Leguminivora glycinivorella]|uniref:basic juvenile hormone-suppressible protein 1-like n=1 Tax=Leguminivora glycinivorella TaxID=1035111 RepID=UPI00200EAB8B|nr:basic juvenile hormone-suppressible protein 1-like [Leguminivora glycinivorella]